MSNLIELSAIVTQLKAMQARFKQDGERLLEGAFKELFDAHPDLLAVRWKQGTPSWNDGEACYFRLGEMRFKIRGAAAVHGLESEDEGGDDDEGFHGGYSMYRVSVEQKAAREAFIARAKPVIGAVHGLYRDELEELYQKVFGDGVRVTITRNEDGTLRFDKHEVSM